MCWPSDMAYNPARVLARFSQGLVATMRHPFHPSSFPSGDAASPLDTESDSRSRRSRTLAANIGETRLRRKTEGRSYTPAEVLIHRDRDHGHRAL